MPSLPTTCFYGVSIFSLFFGGRYLSNFFSSRVDIYSDEKNKDLEEKVKSVVVESKLNKLVDVALKKIEKWKKDNRITQEISLVYGTGKDRTTIKIGSTSTLINNEDKSIFLSKKLRNIDVTPFEQLALALENKKIEVVDEHGAKRNYNYSEYLKYQGKNKPLILEQKQVFWSVGKSLESHTFWFPQNITPKKQTVFDYFDINYQTPLTKIQNWEKENNCTISLVISETKKQYLTTQQLFEHPYNPIASDLFRSYINVGQYDEIQNQRSKTTKTLNKIEKLAQDLVKKIIDIKLENLQAKKLQYNQALLNECQKNKNSIQLRWWNVTWTKKDNKTYTYALWTHLAGQTTDKNWIINNSEDS